MLNFTNQVHKHHTYIKRYEKELSQLKDERDRMDERCVFFREVQRKKNSKKERHRGREATRQREF